MAYNIHFDNELEFLHLRFQAPDSLEEHLCSRNELVDLSRQHSTNKVLLDLSNFHDITSMSLKERYHYGTSWDQGLAGDLRFAMLVPPRREHQNDWYFISHLMKEDGMVCKMFYLESKARDWLSVLR